MAHNNSKEDEVEESPGPAGKESGSGLIKILSPNLALITWLVFLGFGGAQLTFYYSHIHYFPELDWKMSLTYLAAISCLGGGAVAIYGLLLFIPGAIWSEFLIFDTDLREQFCYQAPTTVRSPTTIVSPAI